jgi:mRNA interferase RelE/StbE
VKEIEAVGNKRDRQKIVSAVQALAEDPHPPGSKKLSGADKYRICEGNYRILYTVENDRLIVLVVKVGHRRDVYR